MLRTAAPRRRLRTLGVSLAGAMVVALAPGFLSSSLTATAGAWEACPTDVKVTNAAGTTADCMTVYVPMNYNNPDDVAAAKAATDAAAAAAVTGKAPELAPTAGKYFSLLVTGFIPKDKDGNALPVKGTLFGQTGGPGGFALDFWGAPRTPEELYRDYNLISMQPRGLEHALTDICSTRDECEEKADKAYETSLTTENIARDLDAVRAALGLQQVNYYGVSWGTALGATYATLFPTRVDKMILDANVNPITTTAGSGLPAMADQEIMFEKRLYDFFNWAAENNKVLGLGDTPYKVYTAWNSARLIADPGSWVFNYVPPALREADLPQALRSGAAALLPSLNTMIQSMSKTDFAERLAAAAKAGEINDPARYGISAYSKGQVLEVGRTLMYDRDTWSGYAALIDISLRPFDQAALAKLTLEGKIDPKLIGGLTDLGNASSRVIDQPGLGGYQGTLVNDNDELPWTQKDRDRDPELTAQYVQAKKDLADAVAAGESGSTILAKTRMVDALGMMLAGNDVTRQYSGAGLSIAPLLLQSLKDPATTVSGGKVLAEQLGGHLILVDGGDHGVFRHNNTVVDQAVLDYLAGRPVTVTTAPESPANPAVNLFADVRKALAENGYAPLPAAAGPQLPDTTLNRMLQFYGPNVDADSITPKPILVPLTPDPATTASTEPAPALGASVSTTADLTSTDDKATEDTTTPATTEAPEAPSTTPTGTTTVTETAPSTTDTTEPAPASPATEKTPETPAPTTNETPEVTAPSTTQTDTATAPATSEKTADTAPSNDTTGTAE